MSVLVWWLLSASVCSKTVNVDLRPGWALPYSTKQLFAAQLAEGVFQLAPNKFWTILKQFPPEGFSEKEMLFQVSEGLDSDTRQLLEWALSSNHFLPKITAYHDLVPKRFEACDFVLFQPHSRAYCCECTGSGFETITSNSSDRFLASDKFSPECPTRGPKDVVMYANVLSRRFHNYFASLLSSCGSSIDSIAFRPWFPKGQSENSSVSLQGYGIELAIKNMEYKVLDDKEVSLDLESLGSSEDEVDIEGFYFQKLMNRNPELIEQLQKLKQALLAKASQELKVWDLKNLGLQFLDRVLKQPKESRLQTAVELAQTFPAYASSLAKSAFDASISEDVMQLKQVVGTVQSMLLVNGVSFNPQQLDMFEILEFIIQENSFFSILKDMGVPKKAIEELRNIDIQTFQSHFLDTRPLSGSPIVWMNDISKDKQYKRWSNSLAQLLSPGWPNEIRYIAQNLYNFIAVIDPSTIKGLALISVARFFVDHNAPYRLGLVLVSSEHMHVKSTELVPEVFYESFWTSFSKKSSTADISMLIIHIFKYIEMKSDIRKAMDFLEHLHNTANKNFKNSKNLEARVRQDWIKECLARTLRDEDADSIMKSIPTSESSDYVDAATTYALSKGFDSSLLPYGILNGEIIFSGELVDQEKFRVGFMNPLLQKQSDFQRAVYFGQLEDGMNVEDFIFSQPGFHFRHNPQVTVSHSQREYLPLDQFSNPVRYFESSASAEVSIIGHLDVCSRIGLEALISLLKYKHTLPQGVFPSQKFGIRLSSDCPLVTKLCPSSDESEITNAESEKILKSF